MRWLDEHDVSPGRGALRRGLRGRQRRRRDRVGVLSPRRPVSAGREQAHDGGGELGLDPVVVEELAQVGDRRRAEEHVDQGGGPGAGRGQLGLEPPAHLLLEPVDAQGEQGGPELAAGGEALDRAGERGGAVGELDPEGDQGGGPRREVAVGRGDHQAVGDPGEDLGGDGPEQGVAVGEVPEDRALGHPTGLGDVGEGRHRVAGVDQLDGGGDHGGPASLGPQPAAVDDGLGGAARLEGGDQHVGRLAGVGGGHCRPTLPARRAVVR